MISRGMKVNKQIWSNFNFYSGVIFVIFVIHPERREGWRKWFEVTSRSFRAQISLRQGGAAAQNPVKARWEFGFYREENGLQLQSTVR